MRKLGNGQSVVFCGSREIQTKILHATKKKDGDSIEVSDVLSWCVQHTWQHTMKYVPLWASQGIRHYHRRAALLSSASLSLSMSESILEDEAQSLDQRYGFSGHNKEERAVFQDKPNQLATFKKELAAIRKKCNDFGVTSFQEASLQEEQERELQPENEREQQVERPPEYEPLRHIVHSAVKDFVKTGVLDSSSVRQGTYVVIELDWLC